MAFDGGKASVNFVLTTRETVEKFYATMICNVYKAERECSPKISQKYKTRFLQAACAACDKVFENLSNLDLPQVYKRIQNLTFALANVANVWIPH